MLYGGIYRRMSYALLVLPVAAFAQTGAGDQTAAGQPIEELVVTGSLIRGTPLDTGLPVEVYTAADLQLSGSPTALEFAKSLSVSGPTTGESYYFGGAALTGNVQYNLRGIGADKTLTLFNGRRMITQNASVIPSNAISRIELLKDGAAVTYGADAIGGVVNFITRNRFEGLELSGSYNYISGSDGDYTMGMLGGFGGDTTNVLVSAQWERRTELDAKERKFMNLPYAVNPAPWSNLTNLAGWVPRGTPPLVIGNTANAEFGAPVGAIQSDFTQSSCEAVGGVWQSTFQCAYNYIPYYNAVEDNSIYRLYAQMNTSVSDNMDFHLRAAFTRVYTPHAYGSPSQPVIRGPARATGATHQFYVPVANPYVQEFMQRSGWASDPAAAATRGFTPVTYRAFAHGGLDTFAHGSNHSTPSKLDYRYWHVFAGIDGELIKDIHYDFGVTYNQGFYYADSPDIVVYRMQEALNGFGGPNCNVPDLDPARFGTQNAPLAGTGDCMWYNPFASNFRGQPELKLPNPSYVSGAENPDELIRWIFNRRSTETVTWNVTADLVFSGPMPIELPGGPIGWAAGSQWRQTKLRETVSDPLYNGNQPCPWPNEYGQVPRAPTDPLFNGCTPDRPGPFQFFGTNTPDATQQDQKSFFGELSFPILERLHMTAAVRHEDFGRGLDATVYKLFGKLDVTRNLALRGSYGTNYQAPGASVFPGDLTNAVASFTRAGGAWLGAQTYTRDDIEPETAKVWSTGAIWQSRGFTDDSFFRVIVDFFSIETQDELGFLATANQIADAVFSISPTGSATIPNNGTARADCSHPLIHRVTFNAGCVQGVTNATGFSSIRRDYGNGPGQHTQGYDIQSLYSFPVYQGDLRLGLTATYVSKFELTPTVLDGYVLNAGADRRGYLNFAAVATAISKLRGNLSANYAQGDHNFRMVLNYVQGVEDERGPMAPLGRQPGTTLPFESTTYGVKAKNWVSADFHYVVDTRWVTVNASVRNLTDRDPPASRQEMGYDPRIGNPLGRTFELTLRRQF
jgi:iron complex outermembrane recepter protein